MTDEKRYDGATILGKVSGLGKDEVLQIWEEVKENNNKLSNCTRPHSFIVDDDSVRPIDRKATCSKCGGKISTIEYSWYAKGLEDGRR